jgi:hypothetical protein|tara:strand:- start:107 stop:430 length:324 start_codon:yes stop_codon:yes gene_type:complete
MSTYSKLVEQFARLQYMIDAVITKKKDKSYVSNCDRKTFCEIEETMSEVKYHIDTLETVVSNIIIKNASNEGRIKQLTDILKLCHQDYSLKGNVNEAKLIYNTICSI